MDPSLGRAVVPADQRSYPTLAEACHMAGGVRFRPRSPTAECPGALTTIDYRCLLAVGIGKGTTNQSYRGLLSIPGKTPGYPLQDSFWSRTIGVGVRHRGAAVCTQIKGDGDYVAPRISV
jgi:hypothetical protein